MDDAGIALENGSTDQSDWPRVTALSIGPLLELFHNDRPSLTAHPTWLDGASLSSLLRANRDGRAWYHASSLHAGSIGVGELVSDPDAMTNFSIKFRAAAVHAGFHRSQSNLLLAALDELKSNIIEHSEHAHTAYICFSGAAGVFEFVAADRGVGLLNSLRRNPKYASLSDAGTGLELALTEGVSRHPDEPDRGRGFRPIFIGLANISRHLRFRTGDHACDMVRLSDGSIPATVSQKSEFEGFSAFVRCEC